MKISLYFMHWWALVFLRAKTFCLCWGFQEFLLFWVWNVLNLIFLSGKRRHKKAALALNTQKNSTWLIFWSLKFYKRPIATFSKQILVAWFYIYIYIYIHQIDLKGDVMMFFECLIRWWNMGIWKVTKLSQYKNWSINLIGSLF